MDRRRFLELAGAGLPALSLAGRLYAAPQSAPRLAYGAKVESCL